MKNARMMLPLLIALFSVTPMRSDPEEFTVWHGVVSHIGETELPWQELEADSDHLIALSYLSENGPVELHESQREILVVQGGEGTLLVGGAILDPEAVNPYEIRGSSIAGGIETQLKQGDIIQIRPKVPHQLKIATGKYLICTTVRIGPR
jgi:hypothetical protein